MTKEEQKAVEKFTEMNLTKKGLYHYNDMQDAFLIGLFKGQKMSQPSLPSNLDDAAKEFVIKAEQEGMVRSGYGMTVEKIAAVFRAGAEWVAEQMMNTKTET